MFGYVRPREDTLPGGALERYSAVYCGLCHTLGERYGVTSRLFLNYDFAFLAMLLAPGNTEERIQDTKCFLHPYRGKPVIGDRGNWLALAAAESVILTHWKLMDSISDGGPLEWAEAWSFLTITSRGYRRAREECPGFDFAAQQHLEELRKLELSNCSSIDQTADRFAVLLQAAAPEGLDKARTRVLQQLLYHLGRWIYLIDAVDDLEEDKKNGQYNPVAARFPRWTEEDTIYLRQMMEHSRSLIGAAFQLLEPNPWTDVMENILYSGLPSVEELVFSGQWREYQKKHNRRNKQ